MERVGNTIVGRSFDCQMVVDKAGCADKCTSCSDLYQKLYSNRDITTETIIKEEKGTDEELFEDKHNSDEDYLIEVKTGAPLLVEPTLEQQETVGNL